MKRIWLGGLAFVLAAQAADKANAGLDAIAAGCNCRLGVAAENLERPKRRMALNEREAFPTASTYKLPIAIAFLSLIEQRKFALDRPVTVLPSDVHRGVSPLAEAHPAGGQITPRELIRLMITQSDNSASDALLRLDGGPETVTKYLRAHGIKDMTVATTEFEMNGREKVLANSTTPEAMLNLLAGLFNGKLLNGEDTLYLLQTMQDTVTSPERIKGLLPEGTVVGHKTGTSGTHNGVTWATNDVGIITLPNGRGHAAIAIYEADSPLGVKERDGVIARVAQLAFNQL